MARWSTCPNWWRSKRTCCRMVISSILYTGKVSQNKVSCSLLLISNIKKGYDFIQYFFPRHSLCVLLHQKRAAAQPRWLWWADGWFSLLFPSYLYCVSWLMLRPLPVQKTCRGQRPLSRHQRDFSLWSPWCSQRRRVISARRTLSPPPQVLDFASGATLAPALDRAFPVRSASLFLSAFKNEINSTKTSWR